MFFKSLFPLLACLTAPTKINAKYSEKDDVQPLIVNGQVAKIGRYDYFARAHQSGWMCGGFLIAKNIVLSAAHCNYIDAVTPSNAQAFFGKVAVGSYKLEDVEEDGPDFIEIEKLIPHPEYNMNGDLLDNDFMLVVLKKDSILPPVCIAGNDDFLKTGNELYVIGNGATSSGGDMSTPLLEVDVTYITNEACTKRWEGTFSAPTNNILCADVKEGKDSCGGDGGGPIILRGENAEQDTVVGIVSFLFNGEGCGTIPGNYARISSQYEWIRETVEANGGELASCKKQRSPLPSGSPSTTPTDFLSLSPSDTPTNSPSLSPSDTPTKSPRVKKEKKTTKKKHAGIKRDKNSGKVNKKKGKNKNKKGGNTLM